MLFADKMDHIVSELAKLYRIASFHLLTGCWNEKQAFGNRQVICLMLFIVCFSLPATV